MSQASAFPLLGLPADFLVTTEVKPWKRLFNSMRSGRATDLLDRLYPLHVVAAWQGDSVDTLLKHYASVKGEHVLATAGVNPEFIDLTASGESPFAFS